MKSTTTYTTMMRVTPDGRPFAKDLFDIFAAMIFQIKIGEHKSLFRTYQACFTTEAMVDILDHLQFTHVLRQPDPNDPSRQLETKTITTFSMTSTMAKQLGQHFLTARLVESATDTSHKTMKDRALWTITSKGKWMVYDFAQRGHISWSQQTTTSAILKSISDRKIMVLFRLDTPVIENNRHGSNNNSDEEENNGRRKNRFLNLKLSSKKKKPEIMDVISFDRKNMADAFKLMMDHLETSSLLADDVGGIATDKISDFTDTFYGYHVVEFISQFMTVVSHQEAESVASEFVLCGWICQIIDKSDRSSFRYNKDDLTFKSQRNVLYALTKRGKEVLGWNKTNDNKNNTTTTTTTNNNSVTSNPTPTTTPPPSSATVNTLDSSSSISSTSVSNQQQQPTSTSNISISKRNSCSQLNKNHLQQQLYFSSDTLSTTSSSASSQFSHHTEESELQQHEQYTTNNNTNNDNNNQHENRQFHRSMLPSFGSNYQPSMQSVHYLRLKPILEDSLLRMYFRDLLKQNYCEENLQFWIDYKNMLQHYEFEQRKENRILSECYAMYTTYLAPDAPKELNIDHALHQDITSFIRLAFNIYRNDGNTTNNNNTNNNNSSSSASVSNNTNNNNKNTPNNISPPSTSVTGYNIMQQQQHLPFFYTPTHPSQEQQSIIVVNGNRTQCLKTLLQMYDRVHDQICKNMAEDSLPRFLKSPRYIEWQQKQQSKRMSDIPKMSSPPSSPYPTKSTSTSSHSSHGSFTKKTFDANDDEEDLLHDTSSSLQQQQSSSLSLDEDELNQSKSTLEELQKLTLTGITTTTTTTTNTLNAPPSPSPLK